MVHLSSVPTKVLLTYFDGKTLDKLIDIGTLLRKNDISTMLYPEVTKLDKQLKYADKKGIPYVIIIGPEEAQKNIIKLKDMKTGEQKELNKQELLKFFNNK